MKAEMVNCKMRFDKLLNSFSVFTKNCGNKKPIISRTNPAIGSLISPESIALISIPASYSFRRDRVRFYSQTLISVVMQAPLKVKI